MTRPARWILVVAMACGLAISAPGTSARGASCEPLPPAVGCGADAGPDGAFHGLIGVAGQGWVLDLSSRSGTEPGCGDCTWTVLLDCPGTVPTDPDSAPSCAGLVAGNNCPEGLLPFRLYLTTDAVSDELVGTVCLGGSTQIVAVGEDAEADIERYLRDVTPPELVITKRPAGPTLTGLPTYFTAAVPAGAATPVAFGSAMVSESITLDPQRVEWEWGDGQASDWAAVGVEQRHRYLEDGQMAGELTTVWAATYTATYDGRTVGPFDATGTVRRTQPFDELVDTSRPVLVGGDRQ